MVTCCLTSVCGLIVMFLPVVGMFLTLVVVFVVAFVVRRSLCGMFGACRRPVVVWFGWLVIGLFGACLVGSLCFD